MFLSVNGLRTGAGGAFCRRCRSPRRCRSRAERQWGVSDPHSAAPFFAPRPVRRGSLTPRLHVAVVRRNCAPSVTLPSAPPVALREICTDFICRNTRVRFSPEAAFHSGERALAPNQRLRRFICPPPSFLFSNLRVSFAS
jgi:hypothetical protein